MGRCSLASLAEQFGSQLRSITLEHGLADSLAAVAAIAVAELDCLERCLSRRPRHCRATLGPRRRG